MLKNFFLLGPALAAIIEPPITIKLDNDDTNFKSDLLQMAVTDPNGETGTGNVFSSGLKSATMFFGSDKEPIKCVIDTGSSWLWAYSDKCKAGDSSVACTNTATLWHRTESTTLKTDNEKKDIVYGSLTVNGTIGYDDV